jgi:hypothetical protein
LTVTASFSSINHNNGKWPEVQTTTEWFSIKMRRYAINTDYLFYETAAGIVQLVKQLAYGLYDWGFQSWQVQETFLQNIQIGTGLQPSIPWVPEFFPSSKSACFEADHSPPPNAEVKNE